MSGRLDRSMVLGVLALRLGFVQRETLLTALREWMKDDSLPLDRLLVERARLSPKRIQLLGPLADEHLHSHNQDVQSSLQALDALRLLDEASTDDDGSGNEATRSHQPTAPSTDNRRRPGGSSTSVEAVTESRTPPAELSPHANYRVLAFHRRGGLGEIYQAQDDSLGRVVALKQIQSRHHGRESLRTRFLREAAINGRLEHPAIVPVYHLGKYPDGRPFYTMRFVEGENLKEAIVAARSRTGPSVDTSSQLELRRLLRRFVDVCNAIAYAHSRQVIHRDLKPSNVMLGKFGETLLIDWGLAKDVADAETRDIDEPTGDAGADAGITQYGHLVGSYPYMSPEQASGDPQQIGPAADIFGLGAILYEILTGRPPIKGANDTEVIERARSAEIPDVRSINPEAPAALAAVCHKALAREPSDRYASARELADEVERWLADEPVRYYDEPWPDRLGRVIRRRRSWFVGGTVFLVSAVLALLILNVIGRHQNQLLAAARDSADANWQAALEENRRADQNLTDMRHAAFELQAMAEGALARTPSHEQERLRLAAMLVDVLKRANAQRPADKGLRRDLAQALRIQANLFRAINQPQQAADNYEQSITILDSLVESDPSDRLNRDRLAETLRDQSRLLDLTGEFSAAEGAIERAAGLVEGLQREMPASANYHRTHATVFADWAAVLESLGQPREALEKLQLALPEFRRLVDSKDRQPKDGVLFYLAVGRQAELLKQEDRAAEAEAAIDEAIQRARKEADGSNDNDVLHALARLRHIKGLLLLDDPVRVDQAAQFLDEAQATWEGLVRSFPNLAFYQRYLSAVRNAHGELCLRRGEAAEALAWFEQARDGVLPQVVSAPNVRVFREVLAQSLDGFGRAAVALARQDDARKAFQEAQGHWMYLVEQQPLRAGLRTKLAENQRQLKELGGESR